MSSFEVERQLVFAVVSFGLIHPGLRYVFGATSFSGTTSLSECSEVTHSCKALCAHKVPGLEFVDESYVREAKLKPLDLVNECTPWTTYPISICYRDHEGGLPGGQRSYLTSTRIGSAFSGDMHLDQLAKNRDTLVENLLSDAQVIRSMVERDCVGLDSPRPMSDGLLSKFKPKDKVYDCLDILLRSCGSR